jgi:hypothetical protein
MGGGRISLKVRRASLFNDDLSNEPNFGRIHLAGQYLFKYQILFASMKLLTNYENASEPLLKNFLLFDGSMFSSVHPSLDAEKMRQNLLVIGGARYNFSRSQADFCMPFQGHIQIDEEIYRNIRNLFQRSKQKLVTQSLEE